jgi:transposase
MHSTHGDATDHRPALKQAVVELMVSQDGGVPMARKGGDGNASESQLCKERAEALGTTFARSATPR